MSKDLKDYIHYYIGQNALLAKKCEPENKVIGEIVEVSNHHSNHGTWLKANCGDVVKLMNCGTWETFGTNMPHFFINEDIIKPILRRLEDMTEDERAEIWHLLVERPFPENGRISWFEATRTLAKRCVMMSGVDRVGIEMTGHVWWDCDLSRQKYNPHFVTHYLLSKGFDLFNLIELGVAIDSNIINK